jgi:catechol 2,3-dioxygenase-like lactoylglutathione lyase family enzyme
MRFTQIKETCFYAENLVQMKHFYHGLLGLPVISEVENKLLFLRAGSSVLLCFNPKHSEAQKTPPAHYAVGKPHFAFEVVASEYEDTKSELLEKGIEISYEHIWPGGQKSAYFSDPEGNVLEIVPSGLWEGVK